MIFVNPVVLATSILCVHAADEFNFGYQTSIQKGFEYLFTIPWISSNCMSSAMNSDFPIIDSWAAENGDEHFGIDDNMTTGYLWTLFKEIDENINGIYYAFENGKFIKYTKVSMLPMLSYVKSKDSSCLADNIQENCMLQYSGSDLDSETGRSSSGHRTEVVKYDPTIRPWYISSKDDTSVKWSDTYLDFHSDALCITAVQQVRTISGTFIGVIGIDFMFTQLESYLKSASIQAFVVEGFRNVDGNHNLVASSVQNVTVDEYGRQIPARECEDEWIAAVSRYIETDLGGYFEASKHEAVISMRHSKTETLWVKSSKLNIDGIDWYMVFIEPVDCLEGYALEKYNSSYCGKCISPATSSGGNSICDECVPGYYYNTEDEKCVACPDGAYCYGGASLPAPRPGHWADTDKLEYLMQNEASFPPCKVRAFPYQLTNFIDVSS